MTTTNTIKITYGGETAILTCNLADAESGLVVNGEQTQYRTADARHRRPLAVALACRVVWPEADWPRVPAVGSVPDDWCEGSEAWDEMAYEQVA